MPDEENKKLLITQAKVDKGGEKGFICYKCDDLTSLENARNVNSMKRSNAYMPCLLLCFLPIWRSGTWIRQRAQLMFSNTMKKRSSPLLFPAQIRKGQVCSFYISNVDNDILQLCVV